MFNIFKRQKDHNVVDGYIAILTDEPAETPQEVFQRCQAAESLAKLGHAAYAAMPALLRTLVVPVSVDCGLALRVAAAEGLWKVGMRHELALPFLVWALKDEYWGVSRKAAQVLGEMGSVAIEAIPHLVRLAERRYAHGRFSFEEFEQVANNGSKLSSLLAVLATAIGRCGRGQQLWQEEAHKILRRLASSQDEEVCAAALQALDMLGTLNG
jgi:HEAT repeat protein